jgi:hypothetical protein
MKRKDTTGCDFAKRLQATDDIREELGIPHTNKK